MSAGSGCRLHAQACIDPRAELDTGVEVGPFAIVGPEVVVGAETVIHGHAVVMGRTRLGARCQVFPFASIGTQSQDLKFRGEPTSIQIGDGTTMREYVTVNGGTGAGTATIVGAACHLMTGCHVAHNCRLGDRVILVNQATLGGEVQVGDDAVVGGLCGVHQFCRIGRLAYVGAHSKVVQDVPPFMLCDGHPAEVRAVNRIGLQRHGLSPECMQALHHAHRLLFRSGLSVPNALARIEAELGECVEIQQLVAFVRGSGRGITR